MTHFRGRSEVERIDLVLQVFADMPLLEPLEATIAAAPVPIVLDHFAGAKASSGTNQPGFAALTRLVLDGEVWVKLSAAYRSSELAPIVTTMIVANPDRLVWGSHWPHTGGGRDRQYRKPIDIEPFRKVDDAHILQQLTVWAPDSSHRQKILVDNAAAFFRF